MCIGIFNGAKSFRSLTMAALLIAAGTAYAIPYRIATLDPANWLASATQPADGWNKNYTFDTTGWANPTDLSNFPASSIKSAFASDVHQFWAPNSPLDGSGSPNLAYFRYRFNQPLPEGFAWEVSGKIQADDDYSLYVNGHEYYRNADGGYADRVDNLHFIIGAAPAVFAIVAYDGGYGTPWDRSYQDLMMDFTLTPIMAWVPEPGSLVLTLLGLGALSWRRRPAVQ